MQLIVFHSRYSFFVFPNNLSFPRTHDYQPLCPTVPPHRFLGGWLPVCTQPCSRQRRVPHLNHSNNNSCGAQQASLATWILTMSQLSTPQTNFSPIHSPVGTSTLLKTESRYIASPLNSCNTSKTETRLHNQHPHAISPIESLRFPRRRVHGKRVAGPGPVCSTCHIPSVVQW